MSGAKVIGLPLTALDAVQALQAAPAYTLTMTNGKAELAMGDDGYLRACDGRAPRGNTFGDWTQWPPSHCGRIWTLRARVRRPDDEDL